LRELPEPRKMDHRLVAARAKKQEQQKQEQEKTSAIV
jgi:hypothetical protein